MELNDVLELIESKVKQHRENAVFMGENSRDKHSQESVTKELARSGALTDLSIEIKKALRDD